jgi:hypothetical protein
MTCCNLLSQERIERDKKLDEVLLTVQDDRDVYIKRVLSENKNLSAKLKV